MRTNAMVVCVLCGLVYNKEVGHICNNNYEAGTYVVPALSGNPMDITELIANKDDEIERLKTANLALRAELENVKRMWRKTITGNQHLTGEVDRLKAELEQAASHEAVLTNKLVGYEAELQQARERERWIPVATMPDLCGANSSGQVIMAGDGWAGQGHYSALTEKWYYANGYETLRAVTHWRPLPAPPEQESE